MEKEVELGKELDLDLKLEDGMALISLEHEGKLGAIKLEVKTDAVKLVDKITDLIPGQLDDKIIDGLAKKLLEKKSK